MTSDHRLPDTADDQHRRSPQVQVRHPDGTWGYAEPIGWREEHNRFAAWLLALRGLDHCGLTVTRTDRLLAAGIGLGWAALTVPMLILLAQALT